MGIVRHPAGIRRSLLLAAVATGLMAAPVAAQDAGGNVQGRTVLPLPPAEFGGTVGRTPADSTPQFPARPQAPAGAPNVLLVLTDDVGFASSSTFGGPVPTPALDRMASEGLKYNNFHTTAMCSPTRAALLTGRNHHDAGMGALSEFAQGYPGYYGSIPARTASVAEILRQNGYNTAFFGKHHDAPVTTHSVSGPFDSWPTGLGFEYFYGFIGSATDQWYPALYRGVQRVDTPRGEVLDKLLIDDAIRWVHDQKAATPDKPFFAYIAPGTAHAPLQAPKEWIERFRGEFDQGWDALREDIFAQQKAAGIIPADTILNPRPDFVTDWNSLSASQKQVAARLMEVYAAQLAYQDHEFGRLMAELDRMGELDNTLVIFVEGDNGASPEGGDYGTGDDTGKLVNLQPESDEWLHSQLDAFGGPESRAHYPKGWAWAMNTPFQYFKRHASHLGGTLNGMVMSWQDRMEREGELRQQFGHVVDIVPTILDAAGIAEPTRVNGVDQLPMDGKSLLPTFASPDEAAPRSVQYFELLGNRAIYENGWMASTIPSEAALQVEMKGGAAPSPLDFEWALYDLNSDFSQSTNVAAQHPDRLEAMRKLWWREAEANNVLPINAAIDAARVNAEVEAYAPMRQEYVYWGPTSPIERGVAPPIYNIPFKLDAQISPKGDRDTGVIAAVGDEYGGWSFYLKDGVPTVVQAYSQQPKDKFVLSAGRAVSAGAQELSWRVDYPAGSRKAVVTILSDGDVLAQGEFPQHINMVAQGEGFAIGQDHGMPVTDAYEGAGHFPGTISKTVVTMTSAAD